MAGRARRSSSAASRSLERERAEAAIAAAAARGGVLSKLGRLKVYGAVQGRMEQLRGNLKDPVNYLLNVPTHQLLLIIALAYFASFILFALVWYLVFYVERRCLAEVSSFATAFLFSIETQSTIGYGSKHVLGTCTGGIFLLLVQTIVGNILDALLLGLVFARFSRPDNRTYTLRCRCAGESGGGGGGKGGGEGGREVERLGTLRLLRLLRLWKLLNFSKVALAVVSLLAQCIRAALASLSPSVSVCVSGVLCQCRFWLLRDAGRLPTDRA